MLDLIGSVRGLRVLDAGCGPGFYAAELAKDAASLIALDASPEMVELVERKRLPNVRARVHDLAEPLDWIGDRSIDLVFSSLTLHYVRAWDAVLNEFARVLVRGGRAVVSTHHPAMSASSVEDYFETQLVTETWKVAGAETRVSFYHRPMQAILDAFMRSPLRLERVVEPRLQRAPNQSEAERTLATRPWFLLIEARKP